MPFHCLLPLEQRSESMCRDGKLSEMGINSNEDHGRINSSVDKTLFMMWRYRETIFIATCDAAWNTSDCNNNLRNLQLFINDSSKGNEFMYLPCVLAISQTDIQ